MTDNKSTPDSPTGDPELDALLAMGSPKPVAAPVPVANTETGAETVREPLVVPASEAAHVLTDRPVIAVPNVAVPEPVAAPAPVLTPPKPARPAPAITADQQRIRDLEHQLAISETSKLENAVDSEVVAEGENKILIHFLIDGFTTAGRVWYRGQELEFDIPGPAFEDTKDTNGYSWLAMDDAAQMARYGKVYFRRGPWPGSDYDESEAAAAERARRRSVPLPAAR